MDAEQLLNTVSNYFLKFGKNILIALVVLFIGKKVIKWIGKLMDKSLSKAKVEPIVLKFMQSIVKVVLYALLVIVLISILGIPSTAFVAAFSTVGLTVGLALQGSLSNFAGGVLILVFKPFGVGDYIIACGNEGTVVGIDIFYTRLATVDNKVVIIPNGSLANANLVNVSGEATRRVDLQVGISYDSDIDKAKAVLADVISENQSVLKSKETTIFVASLDASQVTIETRVWVNSGDYWTVRWALLEAYKKALDANAIEIPFNQLAVTLKGQENVVE